MYEFKNAVEFKDKLDKIAKRMANCDFNELRSYHSIIACILEAKGIISSKEHEFYKSISNREVI